MSESEPKVSKLAVTSFVLGLIPVVSFVVMYSFLRLPALSTQHSSNAVLGVMVAVFLYCVPALALIFCIAANIVVRRSSGNLRGKNLICFGLCGALFGIVTIWSIGPCIAYQNDTRCNLCVENVNSIIQAKAKWAEADTVASGNNVTWKDILPYLPNGKPRCLDAGVYEINAIGINPECSYEMHKDSWEFEKKQ